MTDRFFGSHELQSREETVKPSSERSFGVVFGGACAVIAALSWYHGGRHWGWWLSAAAVFALTALLVPHWLAPLNRLWTRLGLWLAAVISPLVLGIVFYGCVTPIGWLMRRAGKDPLRLRYDSAADSYWIRREPPGPAPETLKNQF